MAQNTAGAARRQRLRLGLTLVDLADRCAAEGVPVHHSQLSKIERGRHGPRPHLRAVLARILDMKPDAFEANEPTTPEVTG